ncbi:MAG: hypothetical protein ACR2N1_12225 [Rubripirellula sp.]
MRPSFSKPLNSRSAARLVLLGLVWQVVPSSWLLWDLCNSPSITTSVLQLLVFLVVPLIAGIIHRSWAVALTTISLPVFAIGVVNTVLMLIMPVGKW